MLDIVRDELEQLAHGWLVEAATFEDHEVPQVAATYRRAAFQLRQRVQRIEERAAYLTPEQYAEQVGVQRATIYGWIRKGQLPAMRDAADNYKIPRGAVRRKEPRKRRAAA